MTKKLSELLSQTEIQNYPEWYKQISDELLFNSEFIINGSPYAFHELEFYVCDENHPDPFTHKKPDQNTACKFYFHKRGNSFQEGNIKGLDITCGNLKRFGGILIRGIKNLETDEYIDGPGNVVQKILDIFQKDKVKDFAEKDPCSIFDGKISIRAKRNVTKEEATVWTPRVGSTLKKAINERLDYIVREYRVLKNPMETKKGLKWIDASSILNELEGRNTSRATSLEKLNQLLDHGRSISLRDELFLNELADENDLIKLYGFSKKS